MKIVFVHGIFSHCKVFDTLKHAIEADSPGVHQFLDFNYPFREAITENAARLNDMLDSEISAGEEVTIIAHSMGGLVSRMALLSYEFERSYSIRYLIMLATPNHGAMKMSQLHGLVEMLRSSVGKVPVVLSRNRGLNDLTEVDTIFNHLVGNNGELAIRTKDTDYVTMPALCFTEDHPQKFSFLKQLTSGALNLLSVISHKGGSIQLELPHDGIVESKSVPMIPIPKLDTNERTNFAQAELADRNGNVHIVHEEFHKANHIEIHMNERVGKVINRLLAAKGIDDWFTKLSTAEKIELTLTNGGDFKVMKQL